MPLFRPYAAVAGLNNGQTALVLAVYILGMLPCYVFLGGISDVVGRKPILLLSLFLALMADLVITIYPDVYALGFCRFLQGVSLGLSMGTGTAYLAEYLHPAPNAAIRAANATSLSHGFRLQWRRVPYHSGVADFLYASACHLLFCHCAYRGRSDRGIFVTYPQTNRRKNPALALFPGRFASH